MVAVICLGATVSAWADGYRGPHAPRGKAPKGKNPPVVSVVQVPQKPLCFRVVPTKGLRVLQAKGTVRVLANHPFGLMASFGGLTQPAGQAAIPPEQMAVTINGTTVPVGTTRVQIASGDRTPPDGVEIPIVIEVTLKGSTFYAAGQYGGTLVFSVR
jgi:hypothetical protein